MKPEQFAALRKLNTGLLTELNSALALNLGEPFSTAFTTLKDQCNAVLARLPMTDAVPAAAELDGILSSLSSAMSGTQSLMQLLLQQVQSFKGETTRIQAQYASAILPDKLPALIEEAVTKRVTDGLLIPKETLELRITNGELVPKTVATELCSQSKLQGLEEGEKKVRDELKAREESGKVITARKTRVETASLPVPATEIETLFAGTDEEFLAKETKAKSRNDFLNSKRVSLNSTLRAKIWAPDAEWSSIETLANEMLGKSTSDPFAKTTATDFPGGSC